MSGGGKGKRNRGEKRGQGERGSKDGERKQNWVGGWQGRPERLREGRVQSERVKEGQERSGRVREGQGREGGVREGSEDQEGPERLRGGAQGQSGKARDGQRGPGTEFPAYLGVHLNWS